MFTIKKPKVKHYIEYAVLRIVDAVVNIIPRSIALKLGAFAGMMLCAFGAYKKIVRKNFDHVGIWNEDEINAIIPKLYRNMGRYAVDFLCGGKRIPDYRMHDYDIYTNSRANTNKGTIIVLAHFGNWELLAAIWGRQETDLNVIAKPMGNPVVENWLLKKRTSLSVKTIPTSNALRGMLGALKRNGITAILIDQHLRGMGTPTPFLGKTAATVRTVAGLVRKTGAAAIPVYALMSEDGSYDIHFFNCDIGAINENDVDDETIISDIQKRHNDIISQWIINYPAHWFGWFHKRFKGYIEYH